MVRVSMKSYYNRTFFLHNFGWRDSWLKHPVTAYSPTHTSRPLTTKPCHTANLHIYTLTVHEGFLQESSDIRNISSKKIPRQSHLKIVAENIFYWNYNEMVLMIEEIWVTRSSWQSKNISTKKISWQCYKMTVDEYYFKLWIFQSWFISVWNSSQDRVKIVSMLLMKNQK